MHVSLRNRGEEYREMEGDTGTDREKRSMNCNKKGVSCVDRLYSRDRQEEDEWRRGEAKGDAADSGGGRSSSSGW